jgi:hypothetical protein
MVRVQLAGAALVLGIGDSPDYPSGQETSYPLLQRVLGNIAEWRSCF